MRKLALLTVLAGALLAAPQALAKTVTVQIQNDGFSPATVTVGREDTVVWKNTTDTKRQVVGENGSFSSPVLSPGQTYSHAFTSTGTFGYRGGLHPTLKGTVEVRTVSLASSRTVVTYGTSTRLSGRVSNAKAGEEVSIRAKPFGDPARVITVTTGTGGFWSVRVFPLIQTTYEATWGTIETQTPVRVFVRPRLILRHLHGGWFSITLFDVADLPNNHIWISRWKSSQLRYVHLARIFLHRTSSDSVWKTTFHLRVRKGTRLKAFITRYQAGPGYLAASSDPVRR